jgi:glycosyltransferase involved in cell wall biosynthesis
MILESDFGPNTAGGAELQVRTLSLRLKRLGQMVTILTPCLPWGPSEPANRCFGLPVARIRYPRVPVVGGGVALGRLCAFLLGRGRRYDVWHVHIGHYFGAVACVLGSLLGKPVVLKISGSWEMEQGLIGRRSLRTRLARAGLRRAGAIQAISRRIARDLPKHGFPADRIVVLPNSVDTVRFHMREGTRPTGAPFTALFVGRFVEEKGLPVLFDAWAAAFAGRNDVRLRLVGTGDLEPTLRAQAERLGFAGQVEFLGQRSKVEEIIAEADIGLLPSRFEGLSNTLLEFMASGLPTIASRVSGSEDFVVTGRNGWLFEPSDTAALADCLRQAAALPANELRALGAAARADVEAAAAVESVVEKLLSVYRRGAHAALGTA